MENKIWSDEEVENLKEYQTSGAFHPYTCNRGFPECEVKTSKINGVRDWSKDGVLIPTNEGFVCPCGKYKQTFAHDFTLSFKNRYTLAPIMIFGDKINDDISHIKGFFSKENSDKYFNDLLNNINWCDTLKATNGEDVKINRKMAYVSDLGSDYIYKYASLQLVGSPWCDSLIELRDRLNFNMNGYFNSVLLNLYNDGKDEIKWHSDSEPQLGENPIIATVNLGATRTFRFVNKETGEKIAIPLDHGDLLMMHENCQKNYKHAILPEKSVKEPRISLTFRKVIS